MTPPLISADTREAGFTVARRGAHPGCAGRWSRLQLSGPEHLSGNDGGHLSVFIPDGITNDDRDQLDLPGNAFFNGRSVQTLWVGGGYALRMGSLGFGFGVYGLLGNQTNLLDLDSIDSTGTVFEVMTARTDLTSFGFVGSAGVRWDVDEHFRLGLSIFTPAVGWGSRDSFARVAGSNGSSAAAIAQQANGLHASPTEPLRIQGGVAWKNGPLTLAGDLMLLGPRHFIDDPEQTPNGLQREIIRNTVLNVSVGAEYVFAGKYRCGLASSPTSPPVIRRDWILDGFQRPVFSTATDSGRSAAW